ncbi:MAG: hypothetical protein ABJE63_13945 [Lentilitoribacter sp.]
MRLVLGVAMLVFFSTASFAGEADVTGVVVKQTSSGAFRFDVTVLHADAGWDHYANKWDVVAPNGDVIDTRILHHPHDNEQPFTRSLTTDKIPSDLSHVIIRAHDSIHEYGGAEMKVELPR